MGWVLVSFILVYLSLKDDTFTTHGIPRIRINLDLGALLFYLYSFTSRTGMRAHAICVDITE